MQLIRIPLVAVLTIFLVSPISYAGWKDTLMDAFKKKETGGTAASTVAALTNDEMIAGLKEALVKGTKTAVNSLGKENGFLGNSNVKIPMPDSLKSVESGLRRLGRDEVADSFIETMNRAAEEAVPVAADVFAGSVKEMSIDDARGILKGPDDAATEYFRKTTSQSLKDKFLPIVKSATDSVGLTASYKNLVGKLGPLSGFMDTGSLDLDNYVTDKAMEGLFQMVALEEKKIRENPIERTTDLLKKVFGQSLQ